MFQLKKNFRFEASHQLTQHDGKCRNLHGHSWVGYIIVQGEKLSTLDEKRNMLIDYAVLGEWTKKVEERLDHKHLNEIVDADMPTSELVAQYVFTLLQAHFKTDEVKLVAVGIRETCTTECEYRP